MRTRIVVFASALLAGWVSVAGAQQPTGQQPSEQAPAVNPWNLNLANWIDFGGRVTDVTGDESRYQRFRDVRNGPFVDRFRYTMDTGARVFTLGAENVGYRDQRFFGRFELPGKLRISADWNQIPLFLEQAYGTNGVGGSRTPYAGAGGAVQTLPSGLAAQVQAAPAAAQQALIASLYTPASNPFETRNRRDTFDFGLQYMATKDLALNFNLSTAARTGEQPWSVTFGFGQAAEVAAPVDTRTTNMNVGAEWSNDRGMLRVSYDGSWFTDHAESLTIDNPARATDLYSVNPGTGAITAATSRGRYALWPTNHANTVTGAGAISLAGHSHLTATLSIGNWLQDTPLLPMTVNTAIPSSITALPRSSAEGDIRRIMTNVNFTTRPARYLTIDARYHLYDFNDRTPEFASAFLVEYDAQVESNADEGLVPAHFSNRQNQFEAEATVTSWRLASFGAGYRLDRVDYTEREVSRTSDNAVFAKIDSTSLGMVSLHGVYEHARRRAADFNSFALLDLPDSGEYAGLRRYDIADRDRDSFTGMLQVMPASTFAVSGSVTISRNNYPNQQLTTADLPNGQADAFGLQNEKMQGYAIFFDSTPRDNVTFGAGYGYQSYKTLQQSRNVSVDPASATGQAQHANPARDWTVSEDQKVHYVSANAEVANLFPKTAVRVTYDFNKSDSPYLYALGPALTPPLQLSPIATRWHTAIFDIRYFVRRNLAAGFTYWLDKFTANDFALGPQITDKVALPGIVLLGYGLRPYTAHSFWFRVLYVF